MSIFYFASALFQCTAKGMFITDLTLGKISKKDALKIFKK